MSSSVRTTFALLAFLAIVGFLLLTEHRAHLLGALPFILLLACPLIHLFHGHGGHGDHSKDETDAPPDSPDHHRHGR